MSNASRIRVTVERTVLDDPADIAAALKALDGGVGGEVPAALFGSEHDGAYWAQVWRYEDDDWTKATPEDAEDIAAAYAVSVLTSDGDLAPAADTLTDGEALWQWAESNGLDPEDVGLHLAERGLTDEQVAAVLVVLTREWAK